MNEELAAEFAAVEALLRRAASSFAYPPTPPVAGAVVSRLRREPGPSPRAALPGWRWQPALRIALGVVAAALVAIGVALAIPQSRTALAELFGLSRVRVEIEKPLGPPPPVLSPDSFARPTSLREAQEIVDFPLRLPTHDGQAVYPDAVYLQREEANAPVVILVYEGEAFDLYQSRLGLFSKSAPDPDLVHETQVKGQRAIWIDEGGHIAAFLDEEGRLVVESRRTVERATLLWEEGGITYRLETSLSEEEAIRLAESLR